MKNNPIPEGPWKNLSCDIYGPIRTGVYILVFVDTYSRFPLIRYTRSTEHKTTIRALDNILAEYGNIEQIDTDNGPPFNGEEWKLYLKQKGIKHRKITPLWP